MKNHHANWAAPYARRPRIHFAADTREGRFRARVRLWALRIICFAVALVLGTYALGYLLSIALR